MIPETPDWTIAMERLDKLEKQNRTLKRMGGVALIGVALAFAAYHLLLGGVSLMGSVEANEFILKDRDGKVKGRFFTGDGSRMNPKLALYDSDGIVRTYLGLGDLRPPPETATGQLPQGTSAGVDATRVIYALREFNATPTLEFYSTKFSASKGGTPRVKLGEEEFSFRDSSGHQRVWLGLDTPETEKQKMERALSAGRSYWSAFERGYQPTLVFYGDNDVPLLGLKAEPEVGPFLFISDNSGFQTTIGTTDLITPRTGDTHRTSAASVVLFDKDKNVIWSAP